MTYYCEHNICPMTTTLPVKTDTVMVSRDVHLQQVAGVLGMEIDQLRAINPQYRHDIVNGTTTPSPIRLPLRLVNSFIEREDSIYNYQKDQLLTKRTVVEVTEPQQGASVGKGKRGSKKRSSRGRSVTVRQGDTLSQIAKRNGTTVAKLRRLNGIKGNNIRAGKKIRVR